MNTNLTNFTSFSPHYEAHVSYVSGKTFFDCEIIRKIDWNVACDFVLRTPACQQKSYVHYMKVIFCDIPASTTSFIVAGIYFAILTALLYIFLVSIAAFYCVPNTIAIAHYFGLNEDNTGSIVMTILNSATYILALCVDNDYSDRDIQVNYKYSNAVLSTALYAGVIIFLYPFHIHYPYLLRNNLTLAIIATFVGWRLADYKIVSLWVPVILFSFWMIYVILVLIEENFVRQRYKDEPLPSHHLPFRIKFPVNVNSSVPDAENENSKLFSQFINDLNPIKRSELQKGNKWRKAFILIGCPVKIVLNLFIPKVDYTLPNFGWSKLLNCVNIWTTSLIAPFLQRRFINVQYFAICIAFALLTSTIVFVTSRTDRPPKHHLAFAFFGIISGAIITQFVASELYGLWYMIVNVNGFSKQNVGITVHKWIMTIIDLVVVIVIAGLGYPLTAFQTCITSPIFHYTFILGVYWIKPYHDDNILNRPQIRTEHSDTAVIFTTLASAMIFLAAGFSNFYMRRSIGVFLMLLYLIYFLFIILSEYEVVHPYGTSHVSDFGPEAAW